ncbi:hypothetical protein [Microbacterium hibisci]|uniref:hypothetical protein n=1 Tax=Microbacterium hibisci TaxID=2036000 RepID=UPI0019409461|nr:hypothetical protein [Microbacterium hibisci]
MVAPRNARLSRRLAAIAATSLCIGLAACAAAPGADDTRPMTSASPAPAPTTSPLAPDVEPAPGTEPGSRADADSSADPDQPVPKVGRPGAPVEPAQSAEPGSTTEAVTYPDGVTVRIAEVSFGEETAQGPGSFPGRGYARLTLELANGSPDTIDLGTSVLTVLDRDDSRVQPVYANDARVRDFAGTLASGETATAVYAFAIPEESHSQITLVVDFDAGHTSAVFRGGLN